MFHRRDAMIRLGQLGAGGVSLPMLLQAQDAAAKAGHLAKPKASADACIYIFLWGGPPQQDTWDMKPGAPEGIRSIYKPIDTNVPGISICELMPKLAKQMDKVAVVRSLSHKSNNHEPSVYHMLTGRQNPTLVVPRNARTRSDFPSFGSVLSAFAPQSDVPAFATVPRPIGHDGVTYAGTHAGFLGPKFDPLERAAAKGMREPETHPLTPLPDFPEARLVAREGLRKLLEKQDDGLQRGRLGNDLDAYRDRAMRMIASPRVRGAFDLEGESPRMRDRYGRNEYGESFLLARRLVEAGVKAVSVTWTYIAPNGAVNNVWDNHGAIASLGGISGFAMLKEKYCLPPLDCGLSALLEDLADRGMLDRTIVAVAGEFGRTPKINPNGGREHWGAAQTGLLAGGGIRGGQIYGKTDKIAAYPTDTPVSPEDWLATLYSAMGLTPESEVADREGRPHRISEGQAVSALFG